MEEELKPPKKVLYGDLGIGDYSVYDADEIDAYLEQLSDVEGIREYLIKTVPADVIYDYVLVAKAISKHIRGE